MRGARERRIGRGCVARFGVEAKIVGHMLPQARRVVCQRRDRARNGRQRIVFDVQQFGGGLRLRAGFGDHDRDDLAREARLVERQGGTPRGQPLRAVPVLQRYVGTHAGTAGRVRDGL